MLRESGTVITKIASITSRRKVANRLSSQKETLSKPKTKRKAKKVRRVNRKRMRMRQQQRLE